MTDEIEKEKRDKFAATIIDYLPVNDMWRVQWNNGETENLTTEFLADSDKYYIDDELSILFEDEEVLRCNVCGNESPLYDEEAEEFYCPRCERHK